MGLDAVPIELPSDAEVLTLNLVWQRLYQSGRGAGRPS